MNFRVKFIRRSSNQDDTPSQAEKIGRYITDTFRYLLNDQGCHPSIVFALHDILTQQIYSWAAEGVLKALYIDIRGADDLTQERFSILVFPDREPDTKRLDGRKKLTFAEFVGKNVVVSVRLSPNASVSQNEHWFSDSTGASFHPEFQNLIESHVIGETLIQIVQQKSAGVSAESRFRIKEHRLRSSNRI